MHNMKKSLSFVLLILLAYTAQSQSQRVAFDTAYGSFKVMLYDITPKHRDLFIAAVQDKVYSEALFNRVIKNFVVQGGEHDADIEKREAAQPSLGKPRLAGEFDQRAFHKMGALGAGRDNNPEKASFLNQIYFVVGKAVSLEELNALEIKKNYAYSQVQRESYLEDGGLPRLDGDYTVFGEVYEGFEVLLNISKAATDTADYPLQAIPFKVKRISNEK